MQRTFPLFQSHLDLAHTYWKRLLSVGDAVVDATCGNGHDTLFLAQTVLEGEKGVVYAFDRQEIALQKTKHRLFQSLAPLLYSRIQFFQQCHSRFPSMWEPKSIALFVYNLGYLPGGDHAITTETGTTRTSLDNALAFVKPGGAISVTCYPGHLQGALEEQSLLVWAQELDPSEWNPCFHHWPNRKKGPSLLLVQRRAFGVHP